MQKNWIIPIIHCRYRIKNASQFYTKNIKSNTRQVTNLFDVGPINANIRWVVTKTKSRYFAHRMFDVVKVNAKMLIEVVT